MESADGGSPLSRLHPGLRRWILEEEGWSDLTPIQQEAIPVILSGTDCVLEAPTAGGKTEAVLFPALSRATRGIPGSGPVGVRLLYLAPLKALLNNLEDRGQRYARACGMTAFKWHGDVSQKEKVNALAVPPDLLMTTPESLEAMLLRRTGWEELFRGLSAVILDEAHNFAAGDRGGHLLCLLERLEAVLPESRPQRIAMSATVGNPAALLEWMAGTRRAPGRRVHVAGRPRQDRNFQILFFSSSDAGEYTPPEERASYRRFLALHRTLSGEGGNPPRSLVFVRSRRGAESLARAFSQYDEAAGRLRRLEVRTHHSAVSKFFREEAESLLRYGSVEDLGAVISTSTLELGIDIGALDRVVQMDALSSPSSFLQRVGRTGRREGKEQYFRAFPEDEEALLLLAATVSLGLQGRSEALFLPRRAFHLLAHQLLCLSLQSLGIQAEQAWEVLRGAHCFSGIGGEEFDHLVNHMVRANYLRRADGLLVVGDRSEEEFLHSNWRRLFAVFDTAPLYEVHHRRQHVGTLDVGFVESLEAPFFFVLGGKIWRADRIEPRHRRVLASPARAGEPPRWRTFGGPDVPFETAQEAGRLLRAATVPDYLDPTAADVFRFLQDGTRDDGWVPRALVLHGTSGGRALLVTYAGDRINRTLARILEIEGVGRATADYREVTVEKTEDGPPDVREAVTEVLKRLRSGDLCEARELSRHLGQDQKLYPFSPFARCLPPDLWAAAMVEQNLDPEGLLELLA